MTRDSARIKVIVTPKSNRREVKAVGDDILVRVTAAPTEGKANQMCLALVADWLGVAKSHLTIVRGGRSREKIISIAGLDQEELDRRIRAAKRAS